jgi:hypothetical protein
VQAEAWQHSRIVIAALLVVVFAGANGTPAAAEKHARVVLQDGVLAGTQFGPSAGYAAFLGIPYAAPP